MWNKERENDCGRKKKALTWHFMWILCELKHRHKTRWIIHTANAGEFMVKQIIRGEIKFQEFSVVQSTRESSPTAIDSPLISWINFGRSLIFFPYYLHNIPSWNFFFTSFIRWIWMITEKFDLNPPKVSHSKNSFFLSHEKLRRAPENVKLNIL